MPEPEVRPLPGGLRAARQLHRHWRPLPPNWRRPGGHLTGVVGPCRRRRWALLAVEAAARTPEIQLEPWLRLCTAAGMRFADPSDGAPALRRRLQHHIQVCDGESLVMDLRLAGMRQSGWDGVCI